MRASEREVRLTRKRATAWFVELARDLPNGLEEQEGAVEATAAVFSNFEVLREPGSGRVVEQTGSIVVALLERDWRDMGEPEVVTVTVEPGDKLSAGGG